MGSIMDMTAIATVMGSIKTAIDLAKFIKESDATFQQADSKLKLAELVSALADAKIQVSEIQQLLIDKDEKLKAAFERLKVKEAIQWESPYYWLQGDQKDGPFCQHCYDTEHKLVRLQGNGEGYWECKACKNSYTDKSYKVESPEIGLNYNPYVF